MAVLAFAVVVGAAASAATGIAFATAFTIAYAVGSYVFRPKGPSSHSTDQILADLRLVGSEYGQPIPWIQGVMPTAGQLWWNSDRRPIYNTVTEDIGGGGGKGGGGGEVSRTNITYEIDVLLGLCDLQIKGVTRIWKNGDLIFNAGSNATLGTVQASAQTSAWKRLTVYSGADDQLPDPVYEAAVGTVNACAYRGRGTVFIEGLNLGSSGTMVNLVFETVIEGSSYTAQFSPAPYYLIPTAEFETTGSAVFTSRKYLYLQSNGTGKMKVVHRSSLTEMYTITWPTTSFFPIGTDVKGACWLSNPIGGFNSRLYRLFEDGTVVWVNTPGASGWINFLYVDGYNVYANAAGTLTTFRIYGFDWAAHTCSYEIAFSSSSPVWNSAFVVPNGSRVDNRVYFYDSTNVSTFKIGYQFRTTGACVTIFQYPVPMILNSVIMDQNGNIWFFAYGVNNDATWRATKLNPDGVFLLDIELPLLGISPPGITSTGCQVSITNTNILYAWGGLTHLTQRVFWAIDVNSNTLLYSAGPFNVSAEETRTLIDSRYASPQFIYRTRTAQDELYIAAENREIDVVSPTYPSIRAVVDRICTRAGLQVGQWDSSDLDVSPTYVRGFVWAGDTSARDALEQLASAHYFEVVESDKIYFRRRGRAPSVTIPYDDLGASVGETESSGGRGQGSDPLEINISSDIEIPAQIAVKYMNASDDYQSDIQYSDRIVSTQSNTVTTVTLPMSMLPNEAKAVAETMVLDQSASRLSTRISVLANYTKYEPTDVIIVQGPDGDNYRMRQVRRTDNFPIIEMDLVSDEAGVLIATGITSDTYQPSTIVQGLVDTSMILLDIPILQDADDNIGFYAVTRGMLSPYPGATIFRSTDDVNFNPVTSITTSGRYGTCLTILGDYTGPRIFDEVNSVSVLVLGDPLQSSTRDAIVQSADVNAILIGNEILQFATATQTATNTYLLSGLLRGSRGTEWAMTGHQLSERAVMLGTAGMSRIALNTPDVGILEYYKGATFGQLLAEVESQDFTCNVVGLRPFSPWDLRKTLDGSNNATLTWQRRSRLSVRMVGPLGISVPLDDTTETYDVEVWSDIGYTTLKRTIRVNGSPTTVYTAAMASADGLAPGATLYVKIFQIHSIAGRGTALKTSV